jgi:hypothetical protein
VGQGSALSPIRLALCLAPLLKEFEHRVHVAVLISYIDDSTDIVQLDMWDKNFVKLKSAYKIVLELTQSMGLVLKNQKDSISPGNTVTVTLSLTLVMPPTLEQHPSTWAVPRFLFDCALTFREHIKHYMNKALTSVRAMLTIGNSVCGLWPKHKQMLYHTCVLPISTYGSRLWLYEGAAMKGPLYSLHKMQRQVCLWITSAFKTSPIGAAKTLAGMPPIHLHVKKLVEQSHIHTHMLQATHTFCHLIDGDHNFSVKTLKGQIHGDLKSPITKAWLNPVLYSPPPVLVDSVQTPQTMLVS